MILNNFTSRLQNFGSVARLVVKTLEKAIAAWEVVIRGFAINIPGMSSNDYTLTINVGFMNSWRFSKKYCGCADFCCNFAAGSSGPTLLYQADPSQGLKAVVKKAEMVFNFDAIKKYIGTPFLYSLFLREVGICLGIGSTWGFLGITYSDSGGGDLNTLRDLYSNADEATGLFLFDATGFFFFPYSWRRSPRRGATCCCPRKFLQYWRVPTSCEQT